jgi:tetratricopeptide (TPR) repeat protein
MFNDFTSGGYLAWSRPVPGGVYIDGRAEYGTEFYTNYIDNLREPNRWQEEVDRRGIQSVLFFHRWPNHRPLVRWLLTDQRWAVLFYDEVAVVAVRKAGHEALATSARASFDARRPALEDELLAPARSWQWPVSRYQGLLAYGTLLDIMGKPDDAVRFYERLVDLRPAAALELSMRLQLARYHANRRNLNTARLHLARVVALDPGNPAVADLRRKIGDR